MTAPDIMRGAVPPPALDAILPLGRLPLQPGGTPVEMLLLNRRPMIDWAVEEAMQAGASRLWLVAAQDHAPAEALLRHVQGLLRALPLRLGHLQPQVQLLRHTAAPDPEGWDGLVRLAAQSCTGKSALLIDPSLPLLRGRQVVTYTAFMLGRAAAALPPDQPLLAHAELPWERALALPVMARRGNRLRLRFDRSLHGDRLTVFAGRALLRLPLHTATDNAGTAWPSAYRFPHETLVRGLLAQGAKGYPVDFEPLEHPRDLPQDPTPGALAPPVRSPLTPFSDRAGLAALSGYA